MATKYKQATAAKKIFVQETDSDGTSPILFQMIIRGGSSGIDIKYDNQFYIDEDKL